MEQRNIACMQGSGNLHAQLCTNIAELIPNITIKSIKKWTNLLSLGQHHLWAVKGKKKHKWTAKGKKIWSSNCQVHIKPNYTAGKVLHKLTSITMRPSDLPPILMSKNTFGFAIAVLANRQNEKISLARIGCSKGRVNVIDLTRNARVYWLPAKCSGPPLVPNNGAFSLA